MAEEKELITYNGNCHCGAFKYTVKLPEIKVGYACNCSICHKKGYLWNFPGPDCFEIERGEDKLTEYEFGKKSMVHKFCSICGTGVMGFRHGAPPGRNMGLNVRTLRDFDVRSVEPAKYDGMKLDPQYETPKFTGELPPEKEGMKIYTGSCHCGAVQIALQSKSLSEVNVKNDNCSICQRNAYNLTYPDASNVTIVGEDNTTGYQFGRKFVTHHFCKTCGVPMYMRFQGPPKEVLETMPEDRQNEIKKRTNMVPVNLRVLEGVDWDELNIEVVSQGTDGYVID